MQKNQNNHSLLPTLLNTFCIICDHALFGITIFAAYQANYIVLPTCLIAALASIYVLRIFAHVLNTPFKTFGHLVGLVSSLSGCTVGLLQSNTLLLFFTSVVIALQGISLILIYSGNYILRDEPHIDAKAEPRLLDEPHISAKAERRLFIIVSFYYHGIFSRLLMSVFPITYTSSAVIMLLVFAIRYTNFYLFPLKAASSNTLFPTPHQDTSKSENPSFYSLEMEHTHDMHLNSVLVSPTLPSILPNNKTDNNAAISGNSQKHAATAPF